MAKKDSVNSLSFTFYIAKTQDSACKVQCAIFLFPTKNTIAMPLNKSSLQVIQLKFLREERQSGRVYFRIRFTASSWDLTQRAQLSERSGFISVSAAFCDTSAFSGSSDSALPCVVAPKLKGIFPFRSGDSSLPSCASGMLLKVLGGADVLG